MATGAARTQSGIFAPTVTRAATAPTRRNGNPPGTPPSIKKFERLGGSHRYGDDSESGSPSIDTSSRFFRDGSDVSSSAFASGSPSPAASLSSLSQDPSSGSPPPPSSLEEKLQALRLSCAEPSKTAVAGAPVVITMEGLDPSISFTDSCFSFPAPPNSQPEDCIMDHRGNYAGGGSSRCLHSGHRRRNIECGACGIGHHM